MTETGSRGKVFWSFAAIYLIWGSTYLGIHVGIQTIPPFTLAAVRFLIAGGALYLWARLRGEPGSGNGRHRILAEAHLRSGH